MLRNRSITVLLTAFAVALLAFPGSATTVRLRSGIDLAIPATTTASEPSLAGPIIVDQLVPFRIRTAAGATWCAGNLQERIVRSTETGRLDFYYRVRDTTGTGNVTGILASDFSGAVIRVGYRTDGSGTVRPTRAYRHPAPGPTVVIGGLRLRCDRGEESVFMVIRTEASDFANDGHITVSGSAGTSVLTAYDPD